MAASNRYTSGLFVTPPAPGYPGVDFFGSVGSQPGAVSGPRATGPTAGIQSVLPGQLASHHALAIALVVGVGFGVYWLASRE